MRARLRHCEKGAQRRPARTRCRDFIQIRKKIDSEKAYVELGGPLLDLGGPRWTWVDLVGPRWTWVDLGGPRWTWVDLGGPGWTQEDLGGPRWTWVDIGGPRWT